MIINKINNKKTLKIIDKSLLPIIAQPSPGQPVRLTVNELRESSINLNKNRVAPGTSTSLIKKSFDKYFNLTNYTNKLKLFSSNLINKNQIILNTKKAEADLQENKNSYLLTPYDGPADGSTPKNKYKYFKKIDMLNYSKVAKLRKGLKKTKLALSLAPSRVKGTEAGSQTGLLTNYLSFGPNSTKMNFDIARSQSLIYKFNNRRPQAYQFVTTILENSFITMSSLISKPVFNITPQKVVIQFFFFLIIKNNKNKKLKKSFFTWPQIKPKFLSLNSKNLELLCANLSKSLKKPVELDLIRLHSPMNDSNILANVLGRICDISYTPYIFILDNIFNNAKIKNPSISIPKSNSFIPSFITGIKIKLAGRLLKNRIIPRHTVKTTQHGSLNRSSAEIVSKARFTTKNKRGTFSISTSIGHRFF